MFKNLRKALGGDPVRREMERYAPLVAEVAARERELQPLSDEALQPKTADSRRRLEAGEELQALLPEAFAVVRQASVRALGMRHFDVQIVGGALLHEGNIVRSEEHTSEFQSLAYLVCRL